MKKLFPNMTIKTVTNSKKKTFYLGIYWRLTPSKEIDLKDIIEILPKTTMLLKQTEYMFSFAMHGSIAVNGNIVIKEVVIKQLYRLDRNGYQKAVLPVPSLKNNSLYKGLKTTL